MYIHVAMSVFKSMINVSISYVILLLLKITTSSLSFTITSGPRNMTVCINTVAEINCGFTGASPNSAIPDWNITFRSDTGSVISNGIIEGEDISLLLINGLQWLPDRRSGILNATNSKLLVGPVNVSHNQSSYQCMFTILREGSFSTLMSSIGTMTVLDLPSVTINVDEICITSIIISLNTTSDPACGEVSLNVTISDKVLYPDNDSKYFIDGLQSDTLHNITVTSTYSNNGFRIYNRFVRTISLKPPKPIDNTSIMVENISRNSVRILWKQPKFDRCSMLTIKHYEVMVYSDEIEIKAETIPFEQNDYFAAFPLNLSDDHLSTTFAVNVTVVDTMGQRSTTSSVTVTIDGTKLQNATTPSTIEEANDNETNDSQCELFIGLAVVFIVTTVITTTISVILLWKLCCSQKMTKNVATIPTAQLQPQLIVNVDNIQMQSSPAYVSIDSKSSQLYQNI